MQTALRIAVASCMNGFASPEHHADTYVNLIWQDGFKSELDLEVDWLMTCAEKFLATKDFDVAGYASFLLAVLKNSSFLSLQPRIVPFLNSIHQSPILRQSPCDPSFSQAVLTAIRFAIPSGHTAIRLLNYKTWPDDSSLAGSPLPDIQRLVLLVLPTPKLNDTVKYTSYCMQIDVLAPDVQPYA